MPTSGHAVLRVILRRRRLDAFEPVATLGIRASEPDRDALTKPQSAPRRRPNAVEATTPRGMATHAQNGPNRGYRPGQGATTVRTTASREREQSQDQRKREAAVTARAHEPIVHEDAIARQDQSCRTERQPGP
jgi:hypothetical protein